jgi:processive 1,2-diacylglycerol beta-glucosyltransferase
VFRTGAQNHLAIDVEEAGTIVAASPRILLLTSTLGSGHAAAGRAIEAALLEPAPSATCCTLDFWSLMESGVANAIHRAYLQLVQTCPDLYDRLYGLDQGTWNRVLIGGGALPLALTTTFDLLAAACAEALESEPEGQRYASDRVLFRLLYSSLLRRSRTSDRKGELLRQGLVQWSWARLARRLEAHLASFRPDVIVATQMCAAALLASVKRRQGITVPAVGVLTDFGVHEFWVQPGIDSYCIAHDSIANLHRIQHARVVHTGIPLPPRFRNPPDAVQAREQLGLDVRRPVVLVQGGGLGLGVDKVAERLLLGTTGVQIVALSGRNAHARAALDPIAALLPARLQVWDWTEQIDTFLRAADVVVGKPGGVTVAEALACGRPLLATRSLRGQEGFNAAFLERHGVGWLVSEDEVVTRIQSLLAHPRELARIQRHAWALGRRAGAAQIAELVLELARSRTLPTAATAN